METNIIYYLHKKYFSDGQKGDKIPSTNSEVILDGHKYHVDQIVNVFVDVPEENILVNVFLTEHGDNIGGEDTVSFADHVTFFCEDRRVKEQFPKEFSCIPIPEPEQYVVFQDDYSDALFQYRVRDVNKTAEDALHVNLILAENGDGGYMNAISYYMEMVERKEIFNIIL